MFVRHVQQLGLVVRYYSSSHHLTIHTSLLWSLDRSRCLRYNVLLVLRHLILILVHSLVVSSLALLVINKALWVFFHLLLRELIVRTLSLVIIFRRKICLSKKLLLLVRSFWTLSHKFKFVHFFKGNLVGVVWRGWGKILIRITLLDTWLLSRRL